MLHTPTSHGWLGLCLKIFGLSQRLSGNRKSFYPASDQRLAITDTTYLAEVMWSKHQLSTSSFHQYLFQSMLLLVFHGFWGWDKSLSLISPTLTFHSNPIWHYHIPSITFTHYKHSTTPFFIIILCNPPLPVISWDSPLSNVFIPIGVCI